MRDLPILALFACLALPALPAAPASAQGGGFTVGDMYLLSPAITGLSTTDGALVHVDLSAGTTAILVDTYSTPQAVGCAVFDPYRQRVVFLASIGGPSEQRRLWAVDAAGQLDDLTGPTNLSITSLAATGDGRIYLRAAGTQPFRYLDSSNTLQVLMDDTGSAPFLVDGNSNFDFRGMIYDAGTNALFIASNSNTPCSGGLASRLNVRKLPLSADGTRVTGPVTCGQIDVDPSALEGPVGWSHGPAGQLLLVSDTNSNNQQPRMVLVDPVTLGMSAFAANGPYTGAAATNAGTWNSALNAAVILDTFVNGLRAYGPGETGNGTLLSLVGVPVSAGGSGENPTLIEIPPSACDGAWMAYGAGLAGAGAFVPRLIGSGCPEVGGPFALTLDQAVGGASAVLFIGLAGAAVPFKGGTFHVGALQLTVALPTGGAPGVPGAGALTLPAALPAAPLLAGINLHMQAAFLDAAAVQGASLTKGLRMTIGE